MLSRAVFHRLYTLDGKKGNCYYVRFCQKKKCRLIRPVQAVKQVISNVVCGTKPILIFKYVCLQKLCADLSEPRGSDQDSEKMYHTLWKPVRANCFCHLFLGMNIEKKIFDYLSMGYTQPEISVALKKDGIRPFSLSSIEKTINSMKKKYKAKTIFHLAIIWYEKYNM